MYATRLCKTAIIILTLIGAALISSSALAERIYTSGAGDGLLDQTYDHGVGGLTVITDSPVLDCYYQRENYPGPVDDPRYVNINRKVVLLFPLASLSGLPSASVRARLHFYSFGMDDVDMWGRATQNGVVDELDWSGPDLGFVKITNSEGWQSADVTEIVRWQLDAHRQCSTLLFAYGTGSLAASEDPLGRGAYLEINPVPEPSSLLALFAGISGLGGMIIRRRK